jgi:hypothetical protein
MSRVPAEITLTSEGGLGLDYTAAPPAVYRQVTGDSVGIVGQACVWLNPRAVAWEFGWRVTSLPWVDPEDGGWGVSVVPEAEWWAATYAGREPEHGIVHLRVSRVWLVG